MVWVDWGINFLHLFVCFGDGSPSRLFKVSQGLRKGDPLSPILFTLVVEASIALLSKAKECGFIDRFEMGRGRR